MMATGERAPTRRAAEIARPYPACLKKSKGTAGYEDASPASFVRDPVTVSVIDALHVFDRDYSGSPRSVVGVLSACPSDSVSDVDPARVGSTSSACKICAIGVALLVNG